MTKISLNKIDTLYRTNDDSFKTGYIIKGSGFKEPHTVSSIKDLNYNYRFNENYDNLKNLVLSGSSLILVGAQSENCFNDRNTLALFETSTTQPIKYCYPKYDPFGYYYEDLYLPNLEDYKGYSEVLSRTYCVDLCYKNYPKKGEILVIPRIDNFGLDYNDANFAVIFTEKGLPANPDVDKSYIIGAVHSIELLEGDKYKTKEDIRNELVTIIRQELGDTGYLDIEEDLIRINSYFLLDYFNFNMCTSIEMKNNMRRTHDIYYLRSYEFLLFLAYSKLTKESGKNTYLTLSSYGEDNVSFTLNYLEYSYEYVSSYLRDGIDSDLVDVIVLREGKYPTGKYRFNTFIECEDITDEHIYNAIFNLEDYSELFTVMIVDNDYSRDNINFLNRYTSSINSKLLVQVDEDSINFVNGNYPKDNLWLFSSSLNGIDSLYLYLMVWLSNKYLTPLHGEVPLNNIEGTLYPHVSKYEVLLMPSPDFIRDLNYSVLNYNLNKTIHPGLTRKQITKSIIIKCLELKEYLPRVDDISVVDVVQDKNKLYVYINTTYNGEVINLTFNIKIYQNYE